MSLAAHIATLRAAYAAKKEVMLGAIRQHFPQEISATDPEGGLFTWLTFPEGFDATAFMRNVALPLARVAYVPGETFFPLTPRANHARFNFSAQSEANIQTGIAALGKALHANHSFCPRGLMSVTLYTPPAADLTAAEIARWAPVPTAVAFDLIRGAGQIDPAIRPLRPAGMQPRLFGQAVTVRCEAPDFGAVLRVTCPPEVPSP